MTCSDLLVCNCNAKLIIIKNKKHLGPNNCNAKLVIINNKKHLRVKIKWNRVTIGETEKGKVIIRQRASIINDSMILLLIIMIIIAILVIVTKYYCSVIFKYILRKQSKENNWTFSYHSKLK